MYRAAVKHQTPDTLSSGEDSTPLEDDLHLPTIDTMHKLRGSQICVEDTSKNDVVPLNYDNLGVPLDTPPTESELRMGQTHAPTVKL